MTNNKLKPNIRPNTSSVQAPTVSDIEIQQNTFKAPLTQPLNVLYDTLSAGKSIAELNTRKAKTKFTYDVSIADDRFYTVNVANKTNNDQYRIEIESPNNKTLAKLVDFILYQTNELCFNKGVSRYEFSIPLKDFVDNGLYSSIDAARKAIKDNQRQIRSIGITAQYEEKGKKDPIKIGKETSGGFMGYTLFPTVGIPRYSSSCYISINKDLPWESLMNSWALVPIYQFSLPKKAYILSRYSSFNLRRNAAYDSSLTINIPLETIRNNLFLPGPGETENPNRDILNPIVKAIKDIKKAQKDYDCMDREYKLEYDKNDSIANIMAKGKLIVTFNEDYYPYDEIKLHKQERIEENIEQARKRKQKKEG